MEVEVSGNSFHGLSLHMQESLQVFQAFLGDAALNAELQAIGELCVQTYQRGNKILIAGNGGSAADAQHFAGELVSRFYFDRPPLSAIALTTDSSILTAIGNDYGYKEVFARQVLANGCAGDLFIAISTSGNSENILHAIEACRQKDITVVGLTGQAGGKLKALSDHCLCVPSASTPRIQECHLVIEHALCAHIEQRIFRPEPA
ncbi:D-sedoheptulose 7-phosphate isomerase [Herbaspirillum sp. AP02]|nr:D-sedoheptulose 7-phosphate isomerase [Herbaspirillum sp. AP02]NZD68443.1 D-sedoheptulose 7-phosphate isomerase [Herbaspirillum sp. AP21]